MQHLALNFTPTQSVTTVDSIICGDVFRVVMEGNPTLKARTPIEALQELQDEHEDFRHFLISQPRGHEHVSACLLLPPFSADAVRTLVVAPDFGYAAIAGTPLMAATASLIATQQIEITEPTTSVIFDTAKGKAEVIANIKDGRCISARWVTAHPEILAMQQYFTLDNGRTIPAALITSGLPYLVVRAKDLAVDMQDAKALGAKGAMLSRVAEQQLPLQQTDMAEDASNYLVMIVGDVSVHHENNTATVSVAWVSPTGLVGFCPAGTGALSVTRYFMETGEIAAGTILETLTPSGCRFKSWLDTENAYVEADIQIIALSELILDPLHSQSRASSCC